MAQGSSSGFSDAEVARAVLALDEAVTLRRRAAAAWLTAHHDALPRLPVKPSRIELAVFTALAQTYGPALLREDFALVLDRLAECGAVVVVQRALWGDRPDDYRLAAHLLDARVPLEIVCGTWPEVFMAQAQRALQHLLLLPPMPPMPPEPPLGSDDGERDDG